MYADDASKCLLDYTLGKISYLFLEPEQSIQQHPTLPLLCWLGMGTLDTSEDYLSTPSHSSSFWWLKLRTKVSTVKWLRGSLELRCWAYLACSRRERHVLLCIIIIIIYIPFTTRAGCYWFALLCACVSFLEKHDHLLSLKMFVFSVGVKTSDVARSIMLDLQTC